MPPGLIILCVIVLLLVLLLSLRANLRITAQDELTISLRIAFIKFKLYPKTKSPKNIIHSQNKAPKKKRKSKRQTANPQEVPKKKKTLDELLRLIKLIARIVKSVSTRFPNYFRLKLSRIIIVVGGSDAAQAAIRYGAISSAVAYLVTLLEQFISLKTTRKSQLYVQPDFTSDKLDYDIDITFSTSVRAVLALLLRSALAYLKERKAPKNTSQKEN